jgi:hypothetical protein
MCGRVRSCRGRLDSPLGTAAELGHAPIVEMLLSYGANVDSGDPTPLLRAVRAGNVAVSELLLSRGAYVNTYDSSGCASPRPSAALLGLLVSLRACTNAYKNAQNEHTHTQTHARSRTPKCNFVRVLALDARGVAVLCLS